MRMKIAQSIRWALRRSWDYLVTTLRKREELVPLEDDPVGEFLDRKNSGIALAEDEAEEVPETPATREGVKPTEPADQSEPIGEDKAAGSEIETLAKEVEVQLKPADGGAPLNETVQTENERKVTVLQENSEEGEAKAKAVTKEELKTAQPAAQSVEVSKPAEKKGAQENGDVESLLEVFKSAESDSGALSELTKDLANMSIYSLLEESKQVAARMRSKKREQETRPEV